MSQCPDSTFGCCCFQPIKWPGSIKPLVMRQQTCQHTCQRICQQICQQMHMSPDGGLSWGLDLVADPLRQHLRHRRRDRASHVPVPSLEQGHVQLLRAHLPDTYTPRPMHCCFRPWESYSQNQGNELWAAYYDSFLILLIPWQDVPNCCRQLLWVGECWAAASLCFLRVSDVITIISDGDSSLLF